MSVAVTGAVLIGQFPEAAMVMVLFNVSEAIEAKALDRARNAIKDLLALAPDTATVLREDGSWQEADIRTVAVGSRVRVRPGEKDRPGRSGAGRPFPGGPVAHHRREHAGGKEGRGHGLRRDPQHLRLLLSSG